MMCLGIPGLVTELDKADGQYAWVDVGGARRRVNVALLTDDAAAPGDWVLIHVGFALARIDEDEAQATLRMLEGMAGAYTDELAVMAQSAPEPVTQPSTSSVAQPGLRGRGAQVPGER
ncbi:MAG TPA: HypC/HybG/HupF family hydrogenase formation chaperone [Acidimicrobiales bacterium]|nr:HypC/HybG/HupF family hydrogenase formation chaperone [Acidimicrobiales bacterium]